ncbi:MAG TPA: hypothetical protein PLE12_09020 [Propionicimonas sp.]|nr:hypothetical protein [Propionicimonas sp.]
MRGALGVVVLVAALAGIAVAVFFIVRRQRYLAAVRERGWTHDSNPALGTVLDLAAPPFGLGLAREVDELVTGTTPAGFSFRVFAWKYSGAGSGYSARVGVLELAGGFPEVFLARPGGQRAGIAPAAVSLTEVGSDELSVVATDEAFARRVLQAAGGALLGFGGATGGLDLSLEGRHLVAVGAPKSPDALAGWLAALDAVALAVAPLAGPAVPDNTGFGFHGHPDWGFVGSDLSVLDTYPVSEGGFGHEVTDLVRGFRDGIRLDAFVHEWKTTHTETTTDAQGNTSTRTVTDHHSEPVCGFVLPFAVPGLSVNGRRLGRKVAFESTAFNEAFTVRAEDAKFASDVIHPRMMEWLLATDPVGWTVSGQVVVFEVGRHDTLVVDACEATLRGWLARIPGFVWEDLGLTPPPFALGRVGS